MTSPEVSSSSCIGSGSIPFWLHTFYCSLKTSIYDADNESSTSVCLDYLWYYLLAPVSTLPCSNAWNILAFWTKKLENNNITMNSAICLRNNVKILRSFTRLFYASTISNTPSFEEDKIRAKLKPLTGAGGDILLNYGVKNTKDIASITIDNPSRKNALTGHMMVQLAEIMDELETWESGKGVILHGNEGTFGSGADLSVAKTILTPEEGAQMCFFMQRTLTRLRRLPMVSLAVVQGKAVGGGAEVS